MISALFTSRDCEKSPRALELGGTVRCASDIGIESGQNSCDQKKNSLSFFVLKFPGMNTGPPIW